MSNKNSATKIPKFWKGRHKVAKGDIVEIHSYLGGHTGTVGKVEGYLNKNEVLVRMFSPNPDRPAWTVAVDARKYSNEAFMQFYQNHPDPDTIERYNPALIMHIQNIVHRVNPKPKKFKARKVHLLTSHDDVVEALTGATDIDPKSHVVVALDRASQVVEQAVLDRAANDHELADDTTQAQEATS